MEYGEEFSMFGTTWALVHFVENNGMAFGLSFGGEYGKLMLSLFRLCAAVFLIYYIRLLIKTNAPNSVLICIALVFAGAVGNIIDSTFYGLMFTETPYHGGVAKMFAPEGGYAGLLHGKVVDMLYFPIIDFTCPSWVPIWGGEQIQFFKPVFNIADSSITVGAISLILFNRRFFSSHDVAVEEKPTDNTTTRDAQIEETIN